MRLVGLLFALWMLVVFKLDTLGKLYVNGAINYDGMFLEGLFALGAAVIGGAYALYEKSLQGPSNMQPRK